MTDKAVVKITLTREQQEQIQQSTGQRLTELELKPETLECRATSRLVAN